MRVLLGDRSQGAGTGDSIRVQRRRRAVTDPRARVVDARRRRRRGGDVRVKSRGVVAGEPAQNHSQRG